MNIVYFQTKNINPKYCERGTIPKDEPISFTEKLEQIINRLNYYNDRLSFSARHLETLI